MVWHETSDNPLREPMLQRHHMRLKEFQIIGNYIVCLIDYSGWQHRKHQTPHYLCEGILLAANGVSSLMVDIAWSRVHGPFIRYAKLQKHCKTCLVRHFKTHLVLYLDSNFSKMSVHLTLVVFSLVRITNWQQVIIMSTNDDLVHATSPHLTVLRFGLRILLPISIFIVIVLSDEANVIVSCMFECSLYILVR